MTKVDIVTADVLDWARDYDGAPFHAMLCDPPYHLGQNGFMNRAWDAAKYGIAFDPATWAALAQHLHPGAFSMAFASARGWHRLACAIEDAGLRIHPSIFNWYTGETYEIGLMGWATGSGFPKATRLDTQIDKAAGITEWETEEIIYADGKSRPSQWSADGSHNGWKRPAHEHYRDAGNRFREIPAMPLAAIWAGHRYGLQALKPALEPIIVFQKPYEGRPVDCITKTGAGAINIEGGRIGTDWNNDPTRRGWQGGDATNSKSIFGNEGKKRVSFPNHQGRWPANFVLTHAPGCVREGTRRVKSDRNTPRNPIKKSNPYHLTTDSFDNSTPTAPWGYADSDGLETIPNWTCCAECPARCLGEQSGKLSSGGYPAKRGPQGNCHGRYEQQQTDQEGHLKGTGTAARFFFNADWHYETAERLANADPVRYCAKSSRRERDAGLEEMPPIYTDSHIINRKKCRKCGGWQNVGSQITENRPNSTCQCEQPDYEEQPNRVNPVRNPHPTVKPISLLVHLAKLLSPPPAYAPRRLLVPFAGSGSECIGGILSGGWEEIVGIELLEENTNIARARCKWWQGWSERTGSKEPKEILKASKKAAKKAAAQLELEGCLSN